MCTNLGGSGFDKGGNIYKRLEIPEDTVKQRFDASKLDGTEAQIRYAQNIITDAYTTADENIRRALEGVEYNEKHSLVEALAYDAARVRVWTESKKKLDETLNKTKTASGIIRNKENIQSVLPIIRQTLEEKYRKEYEEKYKKKIKR